MCVPVCMNVYVFKEKNMTKKINKRFTNDWTISLKQKQIIYKKYKLKKYIMPVSY